MGCGASSDASNSGAKNDPASGKISGEDWQAVSEKIAAKRGAALDLSSLGLNSMPPIGKPETVKVLTLKQNFLNQLSPDWGEWTNLEEVDLRGNRFLRVPPGLITAPALTTLHVGHNPISRTFGFDSLPNMKKLSKFSCDNAGVHALPEVFKNCDSITELDLSGNIALDLNVNLTISKMKKLEIINISECRFKDQKLPKGLQYCCYLTKLDVSGNKLTMDDPKTFGKFARTLKTLICVRCGLKRLPLALANSRTINCSDDQQDGGGGGEVSSFGGGGGSRQQPSLLDNHQQPTPTPEGGGGVDVPSIAPVVAVTANALPNLTELNLNENRELTSLKGIGSLKALKVLSLTDCNLRNLLPGSDEVPWLEDLNLSDNFRLQLLDGFGICFPNLKTLRVMNCPFSEHAATSDVLWCNLISKVRGIEHLWWSANWGPAKDIYTRRVPLHIVALKLKSINGSKVREELFCGNHSTSSSNNNNIVVCGGGGENEKGDDDNDDSNASSSSDGDDDDDDDDGNSDQQAVAEDVQSAPIAVVEISNENETNHPVPAAPPPPPPGGDVVGGDRATSVSPTNTATTLSSEPQKEEAQKQKQKKDGRRHHLKNLKKNSNNDNGVADAMIKILGDGYYKIDWNYEASAVTTHLDILETLVEYAATSVNRGVETNNEMKNGERAAAAAAAAEEEGGGPNPFPPPPSTTSETSPSPQHQQRQQHHALLAWIRRTAMQRDELKAAAAATTIHAAAQDHPFAFPNYSSGGGGGGDGGNSSGTATPVVLGGRSPSASIDVGGGLLALGPSSSAKALEVAALSSKHTFSAEGIHGDDDDDDDDENGGKDEKAPTPRKKKSEDDLTALMEPATPNEPSITGVGTTYNSSNNNPASPNLPPAVLDATQGPEFSNASPTFASSQYQNHPSPPPPSSSSLSPGSENRKQQPPSAASREAASLGGTTSPSAPSPMKEYLFQTNFPTHYIQYQMLVFRYLVFLVLNWERNRFATAVLTDQQCGHTVLPPRGNSDEPTAAVAAGTGGVATTTTTTTTTTASSTDVEQNSGGTSAGTGVPQQEATNTTTAVAPNRPPPKKDKCPNTAPTTTTTPPYRFIKETVILIPPPDVATVHYAHMMIDPVNYGRDCKRLFRSDLTRMMVEMDSRKTAEKQRKQKAMNNGNYRDDDDDDEKRNGDKSGGSGGGGGGLDFDPLEEAPFFIPFNSYRNYFPSATATFRAAANSLGSANLGGGPSPSSSASPVGSPGDTTPPLHTGHKPPPKVGGPPSGGAGDTGVVPPPRSPATPGTQLQIALEENERAKQGKALKAIQDMWNHKVTEAKTKLLQQSESSNEIIHHHHHPLLKDLSWLMYDADFSSPTSLNPSSSFLSLQDQCMLLGLLFPSWTPHMTRLRRRWAANLRQENQNSNHSNSPNYYASSYHHERSNSMSMASQGACHHHHYHHQGGGGFLRTTNDVGAGIDTSAGNTNTNSNANFLKASNSSSVYNFSTVSSTLTSAAVSPMISPRDNRNESRIGGENSGNGIGAGGGGNDPLGGGSTTVVVHPSELLQRRQQHQQQQQSSSGNNGGGGGAVTSLLAMPTTTSQENTSFNNPIHHDSNPSSSLHLIAIDYSHITDHMFFPSTDLSSCLLEFYSLALDFLSRRKKYESITSESWTRYTKFLSLAALYGDGRCPVPTLGIQLLLTLHRTTPLKYRRDLRFLGVGGNIDGGVHRSSSAAIQKSSSEKTSEEEEVMSVAAISDSLNVPLLTWSLTDETASQTAELWYSVFKEHITLQHGKATVLLAGNGGRSGVGSRRASATTSPTTEYYQNENGTGVVEGGGGGATAAPIPPPGGESPVLNGALKKAPSFRFLEKKQEGSSSGGPPPSGGALVRRRSSLKGSSVQDPTGGGGGGSNSAEGIGGTSVPPPAKPRVRRVMITTDDDVDMQ